MAGRPSRLKPFRRPPEEPSEAAPAADVPAPKTAEVVEQAARGVPGNNHAFTQPIEMRLNELIVGVGRTSR